MQFDVVVGNPPYQLSTGGVGGAATPIYDRFVEQAAALNARYLCMVIPSRWMSGGRNLDGFRDRMLSDASLRKLVDYQDATQVFPGINLNGGVCFFLKERSYAGDCEVTHVASDGTESVLERSLAEFDKFVRINDAVEVLRKVRAKVSGTFEHRVSTQKPFGIRTFEKGESTDIADDAVKLYTNAGIRWMSRGLIQANDDWIDQPKVLIPRGTDGNEKYPLPILTEPIVADNPSACTETYLVIGPLSSPSEARSCASYMKTKFFRFLLHLRKPTQDNSRDKFAFIPEMDLSVAWTDPALYSFFGLSREEIDLIEGLIRDM